MKGTRIVCEQVSVHLPFGSSVFRYRLLLFRRVRAISRLTMAGHKSLKDTAKDNPTALGDPVSLKAETSNTSPTEKDRPNKASGARIEQDSPSQGVKDLAPTEQDIDKDQSDQNPVLNPSDKHNKSLKELAEQNLQGAKKGNRSMLGDPISLKAETSDRDPVKGGEEDGTGRSGATPTKGKGWESKL